MINFLKIKSKWGFEECEDSKTSLIFEGLSLLPSHIFWELLSQSSSIPSQNPGNFLNITFWPHWEAKNTKNSKFVEPDIFIEFENIDVIIEAKIGMSNLQYPAQWENEIISYYNEYDRNKHLIVIAVDGNLNFKTEIIRGIQIYKTSWGRIYQSLLFHKEKINSNLYELLEKAFELTSIKPFVSINSLLEEIKIVAHNNNFSKMDNIKFLMKEVTTARNLLNKYNERIISIVENIKSLSEYPCNNSKGWNRFSFYENLSSKEFDITNGYEIELYKKQLEDGSWIRLEVLHIMEDESPSLILMFTFQYNRYENWPAWPDNHDNKWLDNFNENLVYVNSYPNHEDPKNAVFIAKKMPITYLIDEAHIMTQIANFNSLIINKVNAECGIVLNALFRLSEKNG